MPIRAFFSLFIYFVALFGFSTQASATIQIISITGYSAIEHFPVNVTTAGTTSATINVIAGTAGPDTAGDCNSKSPEFTCNNCANTPNDDQVCNSNRVHGGLNFRIRYRSTGSAAKSGLPIVTEKTKLQKVAGFTSSIASNIILPAGQTVELTLTWAQICTALGGSCDTDLPTTLLYFGVSADGNTLAAGDDSIGINFQVMKTISENGTDSSVATDCSGGLKSTDKGGPCEFSVVAGDSRVVIPEYTPPDGFPSVTYTSAAPPAQVPKVFTKVRVLCKTAPANYKGNENKADLIQRFRDADINPRDSVCADLAIEADGTLTPDSISDFENGETYFFRLAVLDAAGNVGSYTAYENSANCFVEAGAPANILCHVATPDEILGVLANKQNCFIATAAFGTSFQPKVKAIRHFRDRFLTVSQSGKALVNFYYSISPKIAEWISQRPWARQMTRISLYPVWAFAALSLQYGVTLVLSALLFCFFLIMIVIKLNHKRRFKIAFNSKNRS